MYYFLHARVYRTKDKHYCTLALRVVAATLDVAVDRALSWKHGIEAVSTAEVHFESIHSMPSGTADYLDMNDPPKIRETLSRFLRGRD